MKFLTSKTKLEKIILKYINDKGLMIKESSDNYHFLENGNDNRYQIRSTLFISNFSKNLVIIFDSPFSILVLKKSYLC